jgi:C4-dicarboxylate transporter DctQ subunit
VNTTSQTLLVWIGILGSALALRYRAHLGVDAVVRLYPPKVRLILDYISTALIALFSLLVLGVGGWQVAYRAFAMGSKMPGIEFMNRGWFYLVLLITGILNLIYCVYHFTHPKIVELQPTTEKEASES